ncbi:MAG: DUF2807 domain-containing protein [Bacteroidota bacterium]|nr:DUF2807 domain-containing protein [Bacteroidota bacterium]
MQSYSLLYFFLGSCNVINNGGVNGNGNIRNEKRNVGNFTGVKTSGSIDVEITNGDSYSVSAEDDDNILPYIVTEVNNGILNVHYKDGTSINNDHAKVYVVAPSLDKLISAGSADIASQDIIKSSQEIKIDVSGSGDVKAGVDAPRVSVSVSGSGNVTLNGRTKDFNCDGSGTGDLNCGSLESENTTVTVSGTGNAHVYASVHLSATSNGTGDILYRGNPPNPEIHTSGTGSVEAEK